MNIDNLIKLAKGNNQPIDDLDTGNMSDEIKEALKEVLQDDKKATAKAAALEILELTKMVRAREEFLVNEIRCLRRKEASLKSVLADITKAKELASKTNNYLPMAALSGVMIPVCKIEGNHELMSLDQKPAAVTPVQRKKIVLTRSSK